MIGRFALTQTRTHKLDIFLCTLRSLIYIRKRELPTFNLIRFIKAIDDHHRAIRILECGRLDFVPTEIAHTLTWVKDIITIGCNGRASECSICLTSNKSLCIRICKKHEMDLQECGDGFAAACWPFKIDIEITS